MQKQANNLSLEHAKTHLLRPPALTQLHSSKICTLPSLPLLKGICQKATSVVAIGFQLCPSFKSVKTQIFKNRVLGTFLDIKIHNKPGSGSTGLNPSTQKQSGIY